MTKVCEYLREKLALSSLFMALLIAFSAKPDDPDVRYGLL